MLQKLRQNPLGAHVKMQIPGPLKPMDLPSLGAGEEDVSYHLPGRCLQVLKCENHCLQDRLTMYLYPGTSV